jgi:hypothetical protein
MVRLTASVSVRIEACRSRLELGRQGLLALAEAAPHPPAGGDRWGALEMVEHQARVERQVILLLSQPPEAPPRLQSGFVPALLRRLPVAVRLWMLEHDFGRAAAPQAVRPRGLSADEVRDLVRAAREELEAYLSRTPPEALSRIHRTHPVLGSMDGLAWLEFLAAHAHRHRRQGLRAR